jgi:tRNA pseudouridine65 synthase
MLTPLTSAPELSVLYRDAVLLVVNKPSGLLVHNGWAREEVTALSLARKLAGQWVYPLHRLDRSASGVLVFTLGPQWVAAAQELWNGPHTQKTHLALVRGTPPEHVTIDHPLAPEKGKPKRPATTEVKRLNNAGRYSLVQARPLTGRLHQIRRHLKHISHPIIGDVRYGKREHNHLLRDNYGLNRLALHARELTLPHPHSGEPLRLHAPLPDDLLLPLQRLGLWGERDGAPGGNGGNESFTTTGGPFG